MYLTGPLLRRRGAQNSTVHAFTALWPNGTKMTSAKFIKLARECWKNDVLLNWRWFSTSFLTYDGQLIYDNRQRTAHTQTYPELQAKRDLNQAAHYRALAAWRREFSVGPNSSGSRDARAKLREIDKTQHAGDRKITRELNAIEMNVFIALVDEHTVPTYNDKPRSAQQADGTVLVTSQTLRALNSCGEYIDRFHRSWPNGTVITEQLCLENYDRFDWGWAAQNLLAPGHYDEWVTTSRNQAAPLRVARQTLDTQYNTEYDVLRRKYNVGELTRQQYTSKSRELEQRYNTASDQSHRESSQTNARVFAELYARVPNPQLVELAY